MILKKFLLGSSPSFKRYRTAMPLEWAQKHLTPADQKELRSLPEEKKRAFLTDRITDAIFVQYLAAADAKKLSPAETLQFIVRRVTNYRTRLALEQLELSAQTLRQIDDFLTRRRVKAKPSVLERVQQCAEAAEQSGAADTEAAKQLADSVEIDLRRQLRTIPRVSRTGAADNMDTIYVQDKKDAESAKAADSELLSLCNDLASASFRGNGKTRVALYHFALMFGMTFSLDGSREQGPGRGEQSLS